jgi:hypothetical protein
VQRGGNRLRINVQVVDAETSNHLWAERFDKPITRSPKRLDRQTAQPCALRAVVGIDCPSDCERSGHHATGDRSMTISSTIAWPIDRINIDRDDEDVTKLNPFLIDPAGKWHHLLCERSSQARMTQQKERSHDYKTFCPSCINDGVHCHVGTSLCGYDNIGYAVLAQLGPTEYGPARRKRLRFKRLLFVGHVARNRNYFATLSRRTEGNY